MENFKAFLKRLTTTVSGIAVLIVAIVALNVIASRFFFRGDVTQDKVFSLSPGTKSLLGKLEEEVRVKLFFSRSKKELPVYVKTYATRVEEVLSEYVTHSRGNLIFEVIDPKPDTDEEEMARRAGIQGVPLQNGEEMFFGVVFTHGNKDIAIPYLDPRREEQLEYDLSEALVNIRKKEKTRIGVITSLPVEGDKDAANPMMPHAPGSSGEPWVFLSELRKNYDVQVLSSSVNDIPEEIKVLIVLHPKAPSEALQYAIDQFALRGGRLFLAVDPFSRTDMGLSGRAMQMMGQMPTASSNLPKLFEAWGIEFKPDMMVGDTMQQTPINAGGVQLSYPFFISLAGESFAKNSISGSLHNMLIAEGGELAKKEGGTATFEPLLTTGAESGTVSAQSAAYMPPQDMARDLKPENKKRVLAALVRGRFKSAFSARPAPSEADAKEQQDKKDEAPKAPHKAEGDAESSMVIVADVDFLYDGNAVDKMQFVNQTMVRPRNDNLAFLFNAIDLLGGSEDLINIRAKGRLSRPFTKVAELQKNAQAKWKAEEERLSSRLNELQKKLNELQAQRTDGSRVNLTAEQQTEIGKFRAEDLEIRRRRREVRKNLREDIEALGNRLLVANMVVIPLAVSGIGVGVFVNRSRRRRSATAKASQNTGENASQS